MGPPKAVYAAVMAPNWPPSLLHTIATPPGTMPIDLGENSGQQTSKPLQVLRGKMVAEMDDTVEVEDEAVQQSTKDS